MQRVFSNMCFTLIFSGLERGAPQPEPAQVFCACGECERRRVDGGRAGVPEEEIPEDHRVGDFLFITAQASGHLHTLQ